MFYPATPDVWILFPQPKTSSVRNNLFGRKKCYLLQWQASSPGHRLGWRAARATRSRARSERPPSFRRSGQAPAVQVFQSKTAEPRVGLLGSDAENAECRDRPRPSYETLGRQKVRC